MPQFHDKNGHIAGPFVNEYPHITPPLAKRKHKLKNQKTQKQIKTKNKKYKLKKHFFFCIHILRIQNKTITLIFRRGLQLKQQAMLYYCL